MLEIRLLYKSETQAKLTATINRLGSFLKVILIPSSVPNPALSFQNNFFVLLQGVKYVF